MNKTLRDISSLSGISALGLLAGIVTQSVLYSRFGCSVLALVLLAVNPIAAFTFALAGETLGRYLFFTAVVPKSMALSYMEAAA